MGALVLLLLALNCRADGWNYWGDFPSGTGGSRMATDGTNLFYSTPLEGVFAATLQDRVFSPLPMTGYPSWDANTNTNGYAIWNIHVAPHGTLLISGSPVNVNSNNISPPPSPYNNTLPVFYWWDSTNQVWQPSSITGKTYPYTANAGNYYNAPDGSVWTCSGFYPYAYRSTDDGHSFAAFDINARVPANYFPIPPTTNQMTFGKLFGVVVGWNNEVVIGTETGGYLHSTNNGTNWTSLDLNFTNPNSTNPVGRIGDAVPAGLDHYGNFLLCNAIANIYPGHTNWDSVGLIGYRPSDASVFNASTGIPPSTAPGRVITMPSGVSYCFMNQGTNSLGGVYRSFTGNNWTQFNTNLPLIATNVGNAVAGGNCITSFGNQVFIGFGYIWNFDTTPAPITNIPPVALPQKLNMTRNTSTNFTLNGSDVNGDPLNFTILTQPKSGTLTGTPPNLTYTPPPNTGGTDKFTFTVDDGMATSAPATVVIAVDPPTNALPTISFTTSATQGWVVAPTNIVLTASVTAPLGVQQVNFFNGTNVLKFVPTAPYTYTLTNPPPGVYIFNASVGDKSENAIWAQPLRITVLPASPLLTIQQPDAANVNVSWPLALDNCFLQSAPDPSGPWSLVTQAPLFFTANQTTTLPIGDNQFFRLIQP
jgi:hypothetical protein